MTYDREKIRQWFLEIENHPNAARVDTLESAGVIYKGFKLEVFEEIGCIFDVRHRDIYSPVSKKNLRLMELMGFEYACDKIMYERDVQREQKSLRILSRLERKMDMLIREDPVKNKRRINGVKKDKLRIHRDYLMYVTRGRELKQKLNL